MKLSKLVDMFLMDNEIKGNSKKTVKQYTRVFLLILQMM